MFPKLTGMFGAAVLVWASPIWADDKKPPASDREEVAKAERTFAPAAKTSDPRRPSTIDFAGELAVHYPSIITLGSRIEQARLACDPVGLASSAAELAAIETASGKSVAGFQSQELLQEAVMLSWLRNRPTELAAVAALVRDESVRQRLEKQAVTSKEMLSARAHAMASGERSRIVNGHTVTDQEYNSVIMIQMQLYVDGEPRFGSCTGTFVSETTVITAAHCLEGADQVWLSTYDSIPLNPPIKATSFLPHPDFDYKSIASPDVGVVIFPPGTARNKISVGARHPTQRATVTCVGYGATAFPFETANSGGISKRRANFEVAGVESKGGVRGIFFAVPDPLSTSLPFGGPGDSGAPILSGGRVVGVIKGGDFFPEKNQLVWLAMSLDSEDFQFFWRQAIQKGATGLDELLKD